MHSLADFVEWDEQVTSGEHVVLMWSRATGYQFVQFGFVFGDDQKIVARHK